jgi:hypothetical protein
MLLNHHVILHTLAANKSLLWASDAESDSEFYRQQPGMTFQFDFPGENEDFV